MTTNSSHYRFPQDFGVYHASGTHGDMRISLSADGPPIFHISTSGAWSSQSSITLHSGATPLSSPVATAAFDTFSSTVDIIVENETHSVIKKGSFSPSQLFDVFVPSTGKIERMEWKPSSGPEVAVLRGKSHGMKLLRVSTGEVVAAWTRPNAGNRKKGKIRFMARSNVDLGDRFEVMAVMTMLSIVEKARRISEAQKAKPTRAAAAAA